MPPKKKPTKRTRVFRARSGLLDTPEICHNGFRVCRLFHAKIRKAMRNSKVEHGGDSHLNFDTGFIMPASEQTGSFANVDLHRGIVDWHTHPDTCLRDDTCTIGLPSPSDMANVAIGARMGNQAHMVYSREGTYTIQLQPLERRKMMGDANYARKFPEHVNSVLLKVFAKYGRIPLEKFKDGKMTAAQGKRFYSEFTDEYTVEAEKLGFIVKLFPGDAVPVINIDYQCGNNGRELRMNLNA